MLGNVESDFGLFRLDHPRVCPLVELVALHKSCNQNIGIEQGFHRPRSLPALRVRLNLSFFTASLRAVSGSPQNTSTPPLFTSTDVCSGLRIMTPLSTSAEREAPSSRAS